MTDLGDSQGGMNDAAPDAARVALSCVDYQTNFQKVNDNTIGPSMHPRTAVRHQCIEKCGVSVTGAARILGADRQTRSNLLNARSGISPEMAMRLEQAVGTPAREWLIRHLDHDLAVVLRRADELRVQPFRAPIRKRRGAA